MKTSDEFFRGAISAIVNVVATFPVHKVMFRQQVSGIAFRDACKEVLSEGAKTLWRGVIPPLLQRASGVALMFSTYKVYAEALSEAGINPVFASAAAGAASGFTESLLTPLERIQTLLQHKDYNKSIRGTRHCMSLLWPHGMAEFFRGYSAVLFRCVGTNALFFTLRGSVKSHVLNASSAFLHHDERLATSPSRQPPSGMAVNTARSYASPLHMHVEAEVEDDYEYVGYFWDGEHKRSRGLEVFADFVSGGLLGGCIGILFYPVSVAKSLMQTKIGGRHPSIMETLQYVLRTKGRAGLMAGSSTNFARGMLSWGLMNACYELMSPNGVGYPSEWAATLRYRMQTPVPESMLPHQFTYKQDDQTIQDEIARRMRDHQELRSKWKHAMRIAQSQFW